MSLNRYYPILQCHAWLARVDGTTVTEDTAPAASASEWLKAGNVTSGNLSADIETKERKQIVLGQRVPAKPVEIGRKYTAKIEVEELNKLLIDAWMRSDTTSDDDFVSQGSDESLYWLRLQPYDEADGNRILLQGLTFITPDGDLPLGGEDFFKITLDCMFIGRVAGSLVNSYSA